MVIELTSGMTFTDGWGGQFNQIGNLLTISNVSYNGTIAPGASVSFGLQGSLSSTFVEPVCNPQ
jgi:hypothetical protein